MSFRVPVGYNPNDLPGQIVDEGTLGRLVDPISGASILNPNSDPNETGIDPLTGEEYAAGTDQGFGLVIWDAISAGLYNATFAAGPPEGADSQIEEVYNEIPYWRYVQDPSGHIRASWVSDANGPSGRAIRWSVEGATSGDTAYFEQICPIIRGDSVKAPQFKSDAPSADTSGAVTSWAEYQPLDATGSEVGTPWLEAANDDDWGTSATIESAIVALPASARFLRTRVGVSVSSSQATLVTRDLVEVWAGKPLTVDITITGSDTSLPATGTQAFWLDGGNINGRPDQATLRLIAPARGWVSAISVRVENYVVGGDIEVDVRNVDTTSRVGNAASITAQHREGRATSLYDASTNSIAPGDAIRFQTRVSSGTVTSTGYDLHAIAVLTFIVPQALSAEA